MFIGRKKFKQEIVERVEILFDRSNKRLNNMDKRIEELEHTIKRINNALNESRRQEHE